jgi:hypothetical protein
MNDIFASMCNEGELHTLFKRLRKDLVKQEKNFCTGLRQPSTQDVFGLCVADVTSGVIGNGDTNRERVCTLSAWDKSSLTDVSDNKVYCLTPERDLI